MTSLLFETCLQGIIVVQITMNWIFALMNTTTMQANRLEGADH